MEFLSLMCYYNHLLPIETAPEAAGQEVKGPAIQAPLCPSSNMISTLTSS